MQLPKIVIPVGATSVTIRMVIAPEAGYSWDSSTVVFKIQHKHIINDGNWSAVSAEITLLTTGGSSGTDPIVIDADIDLTFLQLSAEDTVQMVLYLDDYSTWAHDIAFSFFEIEG